MAAGSSANRKFESSPTGRCYWIAMTTPTVSPMAMPATWDLVADDYTNDLVPVFEGYARDALMLALVAPGDAVLDVACGPGTLSLLAAERGVRVNAIDFSPRMLASLEARAKARGLTVDARLGDGMSLPFADGSFDAAFSMFGLMFFPDRPRGLRELHRTLKPTGRAVVSSWKPMGEVPLLAAMFAAFQEQLPHLPFAPRAMPLSEPDAFGSELVAAGFAEVMIHEATYGYVAPSPRAFLEFNDRSSAPFVLLRRSMPADEWRAVFEGVVARLEATFGPGPLQVDMPALIGVGRRL